MKRKNDSVGFKKQDWDSDLILPRIEKRASSSSDGYASPTFPYSDRDRTFHLRDIVVAIQRGDTCDSIRSLLSPHQAELQSLKLKEEICGTVDDVPGFFFVIESGSADMVKMWASYGGDVNATYRGVPQLVYAAVRCLSPKADGPTVVATLLSLGVSIDVIPQPFYSPIDRDLPESGPPDFELAPFKHTKTAWTLGAGRQLLTAALNSCFSLRYALHRASTTEPLSGANQAIAKKHSATELLGVHYFLVGQTQACQLLVEIFMAELALGTDRPLILLFAGPSGHGKTELAQNMGKLLSLDLQTVDCTNLRTPMDLFGPFFPFEGYDKGSVVNNFLDEHNSQRSIVFLDEFEKTEQKVQEALLLPFQSGLHLDRRNLKLIDCSKTIWILATNAFDDHILSFCKTHYRDLFTNTVGLDRRASEQARKLGKKLSAIIKKESITKFGAPLTGRITSVIPFLTFSPTEQAAVACKEMDRLKRKLARPVKLCDDLKLYRPVGNIKLQIPFSYSVCKALASQGYVEQLGARSIINIADSEVALPLVTQYLAAREEVSEDQPESGFTVTVDADLGIIEVSEQQNTLLEEVSLTLNSLRGKI
ncbi:P-loop containing nucleoside triphosphate hydrolase protein [Apiosordaria backusii]|uniref:P-loop containing nucleoside triphosphate hydrolase protein n=1 Tax=Apiosordaria backusii TaxID=314023 RepID=A0AA39ZVE5_9PEZI|nr:P-loop containing nucleoside triphosphate hydrolase protein [Apiosordaria backusii]